MKKQYFIFMVLFLILVGSLNYCLAMQPQKLNYKEFIEQYQRTKTALKTLIAFKVIDKDGYAHIDEKHVLADHKKPCIRALLAQSATHVISFFKQCKRVSLPSKKNAVEDKKRKFALALFPLFKEITTATVKGEYTKVMYVSDDVLSCPHITSSDAKEMFQWTMHQIGLSIEKK